MDSDVELACVLLIFEQACARKASHSQCKEVCRPQMAFWPHVKGSSSGQSTQAEFLRGHYDTGAGLMLGWGLWLTGKKEASLTKPSSKTRSSQHIPSAVPRGSRGLKLSRKKFESPESAGNRKEGRESSSTRSLPMIYAKPRNPLSKLPLPQHIPHLQSPL